ncbi:MAG TPA: TRAM domain-containing protein [Bryobacteraceae bacterium]|nr:TRAM domain-containing protein [Bryobacteraceae bacterium]
MKLIELGKLYDCKIVTNDFNLNKVAQLHGVDVLNINELANALKPVVLPGETMRVFVLKEGKEYNQGVAYLDDGTMVVIDNARRMISKTIDISVTSVLQTTAGKMIFGRFDERSHGIYDNKPSADRHDRGSREHSASAAAGPSA